MDTSLRVSQVSQVSQGSSVSTLPSVLAPTKNCLTLRVKFFSDGFSWNPLTSLSGNFRTFYGYFLDRSTPGKVVIICVGALTLISVVKAVQYCRKPTPPKQPGQIKTDSTEPEPETPLSPKPTKQDSPTKNPETHPNDADQPVDYPFGNPDSDPVEKVGEGEGQIDGEGDEGDGRIEEGEGDEGDASDEVYVPNADLAETQSTDSSNAIASNPSSPAEKTSVLTSALTVQTDDTDDTTMGFPSFIDSSSNITNDPSSSQAQTSAPSTPITLSTPKVNEPAQGVSEQPSTPKQEVLEPTEFHFVPELAAATDLTEPLMVRVPGPSPEKTQT